MTDAWWSYSISDLVLFTPETWFRLFAQHHREWWPLQLLGKTFAVIILLCLWLRPAHRGRVIAGVLAACWAWVGWAFLHQRFAPIHWAADWYAAAFVLEAALLSAYAASGRNLQFDTRRSPRTLTGVSMLLVALLVMPATGLLAGRDWLETELFGMTPDATVLATLGLLLLTPGRRSWPLLVLPLSWCLVSGATLWVLRAPGAFVLPLAAGMVIILNAVPRKPGSHHSRR